MRVDDPALIPLRQARDALTEAARHCRDRRVRRVLLIQAAEIDMRLRAVDRALRRQRRWQAVMRVGRHRPAFYVVGLSSVGIVLAAVMSVVPSPWSWWPVLTGLLVGWFCCLLTVGLVGSGGVLRGPASHVDTMPDTCLR
jgi:hypothetical protein